MASSAIDPTQTTYSLFNISSSNLHCWGRHDQADNYHFSPRARCVLSFIIDGIDLNRQFEVESSKAVAAKKINK